MSYRFVPWVKCGVGTATAAQEDLSEAVPSSAVLPVLLRINDRHDASINLRLFGPGDITGIDQRQIVRVEPPQDRMVHPFGKLTVREPVVPSDIEIAEFLASAASRLRRFEAAA